MTREKAWELLNEYTKSEGLVRHGLCVEASMRYYARLNGADEELWGIVGLLHDFDYERWPDPADHTTQGARILAEAGFTEEVIGAIRSHVPWAGEDFPRDTPLRQTLFAVDELSGFIYAVALVRPEQLGGMKPSSVKKKMKQKSFAAAVSREDIEAGAELLGLELSTHIGNCIAALQEQANALGLANG
jgi:putative nucleotidyltransferase with HDIG domain